MKITRYISGCRRVEENLLPSTILDLEILNETSYYDEKIERLTEKLRIVTNVLSALLDELPEETVRNVLKNSTHGMAFDGE